MTITVLKSSFKKNKPKEITYRNYKDFKENDFKQELKDNLISGISNYESFESIFVNVLNKYAPLKKKMIRANHVPYMTKTLRRAIMKRSELESKYYKNNINENRRLYKKQNNYCSRLYKKERKKYYQNLDLKNITDNKLFWKTIKPFLSDKNTQTSQITLVQGNNIISNEKDISESFSSFFQNTVSELNINIDENLLSSTDDLTDPIDIAIQKFKNHPSIRLIKENTTSAPNFDFDKVSLSEVEQEIQHLNRNKCGTFESIPTKLLKENSDICSATLLRIWNEQILESKTFPKNLKLANITPIFKKGDSNLTKNYRPISVLPSVSKVFERLIQKQLLSHINQFLSPYLCGYRKGYNAQCALITMIEKWKETLDKNGYAGAILMDLSKAFDTINYELLIAKLDAYGIKKDSLKLIHSYLTDRWQRTKINATFSSWYELLQGVPPGSVLGPILFNIYLNDLFFSLKNIDVCNFADDTTPYICDQTLEGVLSRLEQNSELAVSWFNNNYMKINTDKCHLLVSGYKHEHVWAKLGDKKIWEDKEVKLLGINIDNELKFDNHVLDICLKAGRKLSVLTRIVKYLN